MWKFSKPPWITIIACEGKFTPRALQPKFLICEFPITCCMLNVQAELACRILCIGRLLISTPFFKREENMEMTFDIIFGDFFVYLEQKVGDFFLALPDRALD